MYIVTWPNILQLGLRWDVYVHTVNTHNNFLLLRSAIYVLFAQCTTVQLLSINYIQFRTTCWREYCRSLVVSCIVIWTHAMWEMRPDERILHPLWKILAHAQNGKSTFYCAAANYISQSNHISYCSFSAIIIPLLTSIMPQKLSQ